jgi:hypothetical protein
MYRGGKEVPMARHLPLSFRKTVAVALLVAFVPLGSSCFGSFNLTRKLIGFNKSISPNKWIRWFVFLGLTFIPVYTFANLADVFFANSVEFWTGSNPITVKLDPKTVVGEDGSVARLIPVENGARIEVVETSGAVRTMTLLREAPGVVAAYDEDGTLVRKLVGLGGDDTHIVEVAAGR